MATIGRRAAVAELPGRIRLRGGLAWLAWLGLHLVTLVGPRNRASVLLNWAWNYLTWDRGPRDSSPSTVPPACPLTPPRSDPTVDAYCAAFTKGDQDAYVGPVRRRRVDRGPGGHPEARGPRRHRRRSSRSRARWPTRSSCALTGSGAGRGGGVRVPDAGPADDRRRPRCCVDIIDVMTFDDAGKITTMRAFWDPAEMRPADD